MTLRCRIRTRVQLWGDTAPTAVVHLPLTRRRHGSACVVCWWRAGGWQDQVGGLYGGVKLGSCPAALPVHVSVAPIGLDSAAALDMQGKERVAALHSLLDAHMVLLYTGKTRLARNLLQRVLR